MCGSNGSRRIIHCTMLPEEKQKGRKGVGTIASALPQAAAPSAPTSGVVCCSSVEVPTCSLSFLSRGASCLSPSPQESPTGRPRLLIASQKQCGFHPTCHLVFKLVGRRVGSGMARVPGYPSSPCPCCGPSLLTQCTGLMLRWVLFLLTTQTHMEVEDWWIGCQVYGVRHGLLRG